MEKKLDEILKSIIQYSTNISILYQNAAAAKINDDDNEYKKQLDYIALVEECEEKEYQKIDFENNLNERLYKRFLYLLKRSDTPQEIHNIIYQRFQNHINELLIRNPFLSISPFSIERKEENDASIIWQAMRDYSITALYFMNKDINIIKNKAVRQDLIDFYYEFIFKQKILNQYLKTPPQEIEVTGRNRCLAFRQEEAQVNECYSGIIMESLNTSIPIILNYTDSFIINNPNKLAEQRLMLNLLKATITIATEEEKKGIYIEYSEAAKEKSKISITKINSAIEEANLTVQDKSAQKKEVYGQTKLDFFSFILI